MRWETIVAVIAAASAAYATMGGLCVLAGSYLSSLHGKNWFDSNRPWRWTKSYFDDFGSTNRDSDNTFPPIAVFLGWPLLLILGGPYFIGKGFAKMTEALADKVRGAGERHHRQLRGATEPEKS